MSDSELQASVELLDDSIFFKFNLIRSEQFWNK